MADLDSPWPSYGACRRCHSAGFSEDGICKSCGHDMLENEDGYAVSDGHTSPGYWRSLAGLTILSRADMPPDVQDELDGHTESMRETRRHDRRWVRVKLDGIHIYMTGALPAGAKQHRLTEAEAQAFAAWRAARLENDDA